MQTQSPSIQATQPRLFRYSLDWRFLLPATQVESLGVIAEEESDFGETLERVGIPASNLVSFLDLSQTDSKPLRSLALPFGLPVRCVAANQADQIEFYRSIRRLLEPGSSLLVGFNHSWTSSSSVPVKYHSSRPVRVLRQLAQAGFQSIKVFGAMPNLSIPEYIFDLHAQAVHFALQHRFRRKRAMLMGIQLLARTIGWARVTEFLPSYYVVATA